MSEESATNATHPLDVARDANKRINNSLADTGGAIATMAINGALGYHINVATGETAPEYLWRVALYQALDETAFEMAHVDADDVEGARRQLDRTLEETFDHWTAEHVGDRFEENLRGLIEAQEEIADE